MGVMASTIKIAYEYIHDKKLLTTKMKIPYFLHPHWTEHQKTLKYIDCSDNIAI